MSNQLVLENRTAEGKKLKPLRAAGQIPSVVYGAGDPVLTSSAYNVTEKVLREGITPRSSCCSLVSLSLPLSSRLRLIRSVAVL